MNPSLQGYAAAVLEEAAGRGELPQLASELAAVDHLIGTNAVLRSALTDTAVDAAARRAVVLDLLASKVSAGTRRAVGFAAACVIAPEVPGAVTWLAHRAHQAAEGIEIDEPLLGHLDSRNRVGGYASALFEDLPTSGLEEIEDELFRFGRIVETTPSLRTVLADRDQPLPVRQGIVDELVGTKVSAATLRLLHAVLRAGRTRDVVGTVFWLVDRTAEARGWRVARVRAAREVDQDGRQRLADSLSRLAGTPVELQVTLEPALLAGVVVRVGDLQVDASARGRLEGLREHMAPGMWHESGYTHPERGTTPEGAQ
jgi:F-type H+-transporting ATPase subunit delta